MTDNSNGELPEELRKHIESLNDSLRQVSSPKFSDEAARTASLQLYAQAFALQVVLALLIRFSSSSRILWPLIEKQLGDTREEIGGEYAEADREIIRKAITEVLGTLRMFQAGQPNK